MTTPAEATAEIFWTAFQALPKKTREVFVGKLFEDQKTREELIDMAILEQRKGESSRSLESYLSDRKVRMS